MPTPLRPHDAVPVATLKLKRTPEIGQPDPRVTPIPVRTEAQFPRVSGYDILSVVGYGGMGIVYEARHRELNRRVALKMLRGEALADPEYRERLRVEAEAIARLQHPNIIQVFEVGTVEAQAGDLYPNPFLALEFIDGGSLAQHTYSPQQPRQAAKTVETLARAAHAAHELGVVHRDLKPANVLLTRDGAPKIADFGIAKRIDEGDTAERGLTRDGVVMGTPEYMAPEQLHGQTATPTIDVYALGVILYELLTGRVPFQGSSFADTMLLTMYQEPVPPHRLQPGVPRDVETICLKCLEKNPLKRYATAAELADDLAAWADGRPIRARALGAGERAGRWARRNPAVAALSALALALAVGGLSGIVWKWNEARANAEQAQRNEATATTERATAERAADEAHRSADKERYERYRMSVFAASGALRLHDVTGARRALESAPTQHRDWVWHLLHTQLDRSHEVIDTGGPFGHAKFTPDGRRVLLSEVGHIRVWDATTRTGFRPPGPIPVAHHDRISPDGTAVATIAGDNKIRIYDVNPWRERAVAALTDSPMHVIEFSADSARLFTATTTVGQVWDARTGKELHRFALPAGSGGPMSVTPDHRVLVACMSKQNNPRLLDTRTGNELGRLSGHDGLIRAFHFSPNGKRVASITEYPWNELRVWDAPTGRALARLDGHENQINHVRFSPDANTLVSGSTDRSVRYWDLSGPLTGAPVPARWVRKDHTGRIETVLLSPDGRRVVSTSFDRTLRYWDAATGEPVAVLQGHNRLVLNACYSTDGTSIVSASGDGTLRAWDVAELDDDYALRGHTKFVYSVAAHPDGVRVASAAWDGTARVWNADSRKELMALPHTGSTDGSLTVAAVAYHPTGRYLATLCRDDFVRLWDAETGKELHRWPTASRHWTDSRLAFSPDGALLAAGGWDGRVRLWNVETRAEVAVLKTHGAPIRDVAFSPNGKLLAVAGENSDPTVRIWDVAGRKELRALPPHAATVYALAWNREGTLLASGALDDTVRLWDARTWEPVGELHQGANVYSVSFHPDGKLLAVACADNLIRVWNVETQQELAELSGHTNYVHALAFSPDGKRLVSASGDKSVRVWDSRSR